MSIELMARVWKIELSHSQQAVLLAMADFANDDGRNCYPSHKRLSWKTGYSQRQISRLINELIEIGIVKVVKLGTNTQPPRYWIRLDKGKLKTPFDSESVDDEELGDDILSPPENRDDKMSPPNSDEISVGDDKMSPLGVTNATVGDDTLSPDPSVNHQYKQPTKEKEEIAGIAPAPPLAGWPEFLEAFCWICHGHKDIGALTKEQKGALTSEAKRVRDKGYTIDDLRSWFRDVWQKDWRWTKKVNGKAQHEHPDPSDVRSMIPAIRDRETLLSSTNGYQVVRSERVYDPLTDEEEFNPTIHPIQHMPYVPAPPPIAKDDPWPTALAELLPSLSSGVAASWLADSRLQENGELAGEPFYRVLVTNRAANAQWLTQQTEPAIRKKLSSLFGKRVSVEIVIAEQEPT